MANLHSLILTLLLASNFFWPHQCVLLLSSWSALDWQLALLHFLLHHGSWRTPGAIRTVVSTVTTLSLDLRAFNICPVRIWEWSNPDQLFCGLTRPTTAWSESKYDHEIWSHTGDKGMNGFFACRLPEWRYISGWSNCQCFSEAWVGQAPPGEISAVFWGVSRAQQSSTRTIFKQSFYPKRKRASPLPYSTGILHNRTHH